MSSRTTPVEDLPGVGSHSGAFATVARGVRLSPALRVGLPFTLFLALIATAGRAVVPIAIQRTLDRGILGGGGVDVGSVAGQIAMAGVAVLVTALASAWMNARLTRVTETALSELRVDTFRHIHDLSMLHQASEQRGALVSRVTSDVDEISRFMQWGGLTIITSAAQIVVATIVMAFYSWRLTAVVLLGFIPFSLIGRAFQRRLDVLFFRVREKIGRLLGVLAETVVGAPVVRAYGIERRTGARIRDAIDDHYNEMIRTGRTSSIFSATGELFGSIITAALVVVGVLLGIDGTVSAGTVVAFLFLVTLFVEPVQIAAEVVNEGQTAVAGWRRVLDVLDLPSDVADPTDGVDIPEGPIEVRFDHVSFRYPRPGEPSRDASGPWVLHDVDVRIAPQTRVAIVGETGSGKTTFAKLLTRLMDPTRGQVHVNGVALDRVRFDSLRRRIVMVPQDGTLFEGTIADNIRMGCESATNDDLRLALIELGIVDWLDELPEGLDTPVGERGGALSAGERQLVALARAYIANPDLLVLDEATSAVDPATDVRLQRALVGLTEGRTTVSIAHRLATAEAADEVLVFDAGRIVERGTHQELLELDGVYGRLHESWRTGRVAA